MSKSILSTEKRSRGRPRTDPVAQHMTMSQELSEAIDMWREKQKDLPSRPEAIRRLVEIGLKAKR